MLEIGSLVDGKYKILNKVGQGGMSVVYLAMNEKANKQWAIKEVRKDGVQNSEIVEQGLIAETNILKKLSHPHLPSIIDVIEYEDTFIIIMDYIEGNSLKDLLAEFGAQPQEYVVEWGKQMCDVLMYLHNCTPPIIYRDMKPANIMLNPDLHVSGERVSAGKVTLIDFGTAREYKGRDVADTWHLGTVGYAAPEQFERDGTTDARTDVYCLGATMYHLVTGKNPCEPPYDILPIRQINPMLSSGLEKIISKCTQRNPNDRYQSAAELMYDLEHYDEIDELHRRKQKIKLGAFVTSAVLAVALGVTSAWGYFAAEQKKTENYDYMLLEAASAEDYYEAMLTDPARTEAYEQFNDFLISDYTLTREEGQQLQKLLVGLDGEGADGFDQSVNVLDSVREVSQEAYEQICFDIGWSFLSYYDTDIDRDRYTNAARWFKIVKDNGTENGQIAAIFCDISECTTMINQLHGSQVVQTKELDEQRTKLWQMVLDLKDKADTYEADYRLQVWVEIDGLINENINDFRKAASSDEIQTLLSQIQQGAQTLDGTNSDIQGLVDRLLGSIQETIAKVASSGEGQE